MQTLSVLPVKKMSFATEGEDLQAGGRRKR